MTHKIALLISFLFSTQLFIYPDTLNVNWGVSSRQGRRNYMEDRFTVSTIQSPPNSHATSCHFFGVYDGHGGKTVAEELKNKLPHTFHRRWHNTRHSIPTALKKALTDIEQSLKPKNHNLALDPHAHAGSTAVIGILDHENTLHIANVGDSRAIVVRNGAVIFTTEDHKPDTPKEHNRILMAGHTLDKRPHGRIPRIKGLALSRTIGDWQKKLEYPGAVIHDPDLYTISIEPGDILIIASDGLWDVLENHHAAQLAQKIIRNGFESKATIDRHYDLTAGNTPHTMQEVAKALREMAHAYGSGDNITVIAAHFNTSPDKKQEQQRQSIDQSIDLLIYNAQELKKIIHTQLDNGHPQILLNNMNALLQDIIRAVTHEK